MNASKPPGWTNYQNPSRPMPNDEFERYHSSFDGLAQTNIIRNQQIDTRHLDCSNHGIELIVFNVDTGAEWRLDIANVCGRRSASSNGIKKSVQFIG